MARHRKVFFFEGQRYEINGKSPEDAAVKAALKLDKLKRGEVGISSNMSVKRWAEEWLETYKKPVVAQKQYDDIKSQLDNIILPAIGSLRVGDVKDVHLQKILNSKQGYSLSRMKKLRNTICAIFKRARASRLISFDPAEFLELPAAKDGTHRSINDLERKYFLKVADSHPSGLMFKVMLYCGLRTGEVVALNWGDIDLKKRRIKVSRAMESGTNKIKEPKTESGIREVPIPDEIVQELSALKKARKKEWMERQVKHTSDRVVVLESAQPVFLQQRGKVRHTHSSRRTAWNSLKRKMDDSMGAKYKTIEGEKGRKQKIKLSSVVAGDLVPYCLRHTYCTDLQKKGVDLKTASYLMGHKDITVTANIYTHVTNDAITSAAKLINASGKVSGKAKKAH